MSEREPITWVCKDCGSENVTVGADARWDKEKQEWYFELSESSDYDFCYDCFSEVIIERPVTDLKTIAAVAINKSEAA